VLYARVKLPHLLKSLALSSTHEIHPHLLAPNPAKEKVSTIKAFINIFDSE
jgi:hypothetical protein